MSFHLEQDTNSLFHANYDGENIDYQEAQEFSASISHKTTSESKGYFR